MRSREVLAIIISCCHKTILVTHHAGLSYSQYLDYYPQNARFSPLQRHSRLDDQATSEVSPGRLLCDSHCRWLYERRSIRDAPEQ